MNKSKRDSAYKLYLTVVTEDSIEQVEALFARELPQIGQKYDEIITGPRLREVAILSSVNNPHNDKLYRIKIKATCKAADYDILSLPQKSTRS